MIRKILLVVVFVSVAAFCSYAQSTAGADESSTQTSVETKEEVVEGFWSVTTYLGKQLVNGMSERLNLDDEKDEKEVPKKKVVLRIGTFEFERIDGG